MQHNKSKIYFGKKDTTKLPWKISTLMSLLFEMPKAFTAYDKAQFHIDCGARKVVISAPSKGSDTPGITGEDDIDGDQWEINLVPASCFKLHRYFWPMLQVRWFTNFAWNEVGIESIVEYCPCLYSESRHCRRPEQDFYRGRAAAQNVVPASDRRCCSHESISRTPLKSIRRYFCASSCTAGSIGQRCWVFIKACGTTADEINTNFERKQQKKKIQDSPKMLCSDTTIVSSWYF